MEMNPVVKSQMTADELKNLLRRLPDGTVLTVDLSLLIQKKEGGSDERKT
ncbi:MAG: hypothetical protein IKE31_08395 [Eubacterium sp.]|nr:hypothetical protein [Eubacterium sp.]